MQMFTDARQRVQELVQDNATVILTAGGVVGTVTTAVLAWRGGYKSAEIIMIEEAERLEEADRLGAQRKEEVEPQPLTKTDKAKLIGLQIIPPVILGGATIGSIIMAHRMSASKAAALAAAYGLSEKQFREYKEKVQEKLTGPKATSVQDELAQDRVNDTPGGNKLIVLEGEVLCFDQPTGRYFKGSMNAINSAVNRTNEEILLSNYASASFFYDQLGLPPTTWGNEVGWNTNNLLHLDITTVIHDQKPCIAIDFKYLPTMDYIKEY